MPDTAPQGPILVAGLGNPGREYRDNRHNVGFRFVDRLAQHLGIAFSRKQCEALLCDGRLAGRKVILAKPMTYMNLSGRSVGALVRFYKLPTTSLLVVYDDMDLPTGTLRLRARGGHAGHKGLRSVLEHLGTQEVPRLRIGIGRPPGGMDPTDYVLQDFTDEERAFIDAAIERGLECVERFVTEGMEAAMNHCNPRPSDGP